MVNPLYVQPSIVSPVTAIFEVTLEQWSLESIVKLWDNHTCYDVNDRYSNKMLLGIGGSREYS